MTGLGLFTNRLNVDIRDEWGLRKHVWSNHQILRTAAVCSESRESRDSHVTRGTDRDMRHRVT